MQFSVLTLFPELIQGYFKEGVVGQAHARGQIQINTINPREFTSDIHHSVDDRPYGGGDGMVMMAAPLKAALESLGDRSPRIYLSPQGKLLKHQKVIELAGYDSLTLICGRYAGVDQRFINAYVDEEISIGDYVLSGGEAAAIVLIDAVARQLEGVLGHQASAARDSFAEGGLLEAPLFTRPASFAGWGVPSFLTSGHHKLIEEAKAHLSLLVTAAKRPELLSGNHTQALAAARKWLASLPAKEREALGLGESEL